MYSEYRNQYGKRFVVLTELLDKFQQGKDLLATAGISVCMTCGWRGKADQEKAFNDGVSKAHWGQSAHNYAAGIDLAPIIDGKLSWPKDSDPIWQKIAFAMEKYGLRSGYDWDGDGILNPDDQTPGSTFNDRPHIQLKDFDKRGFKLCPDEPQIV